MITSANISRPSPIGEAKQNPIGKIAFLALLGILSFASFGYFLKLLLIRQDFNSFLFLTLSFILFLAVFVLQAVFLKINWISFLIIFLECLGLATSLYENIADRNIQFGIGAAFLILIIANRNGRRELEDFVKIRFWKTAKIIIPKAMAAIFLFLSIFFIYGTSAGGGSFISKENFDKFLEPNKFLIDRFFPGFDFSLTINEFAKKTAESELTAAPQFKNIPTAAKNQLIAQSAKEFENKISQMAGFPLNPKSKISDAIYDGLKNKLDNLPQSIKPYVSIIAILIVFLFFEGFAIPIRWIISFVSFLLYEILLALGFAKIELEGGSREIIVL